MWLITTNKQYCQNMKKQLTTQKGAAAPDKQDTAQIRMCNMFSIRPSLPYTQQYNRQLADCDF
jgi:hypothetical protein